MKKVKIALVFIASAAVFISCKDEKQEQAQMTVDNYKNYVDSISNVAEDNAAENWNNIEENYNQLKMEAETAISTGTDQEKLKTDFDNAAMKYDDYKDKVVVAKDKMTMVRLVGTDYVDDDMKFQWVNKDNIVAVYENLVTTVEQNKDSYTREDWDKIKLVYEALDSRKNTVEKEGLSSKDNMKIAGLKVKFAPMYTVNRMGAKSEENAEAKE